MVKRQGRNAWADLPSNRDFWQRHYWSRAPIRRSTDSIKAPDLCGMSCKSHSSPFSLPRQAPGTVSMHAWRFSRIHCLYPPVVDRPLRQNWSSKNRELNAFVLKGVQTLGRILLYPRIHRASCRTHKPSTHWSRKACRGNRPTRMLSCATDRRRGYWQRHRCHMSRPMQWELGHWLRWRGKTWIHQTHSQSRGPNYHPRRPVRPGRTREPECTTVRLQKTQVPANKQISIC